MCDKVKKATGRKVKFHMQRPRRHTNIDSYTRVHRPTYHLRAEQSTAMVWPTQDTGAVVCSQDALRQTGSCYPAMTGSAIITLYRRKSCSFSPAWTDQQDTAYQEEPSPRDWEPSTWVLYSSDDVIEEATLSQAPTNSLHSSKEMNSIQFFKLPEDSRQFISATKLQTTNKIYTVENSLGQGFSLVRHQPERQDAGALVFILMLTDMLTKYWKQGSE